jgi:predicted dehydrogenase
VKSISQSLESGEIALLDSPTPAVGAHTLLIRTTRSVISAGTERMLLEFGRGGWLAKAKSQPDRVRQVLNKARTDGVAATVDAVRAKLATPIAPGYCNAGVVIETGAGVTGFAPGDRVVSNGPHAEFVSVAETLVARIPDGVSDDAAAFTPLAAIALSGIRLAAPTLGETVVVYGLGLIGQLSVQLLRASGCRVIGIDRDPARLALAAKHGAETISGDDVESLVRQVRARTDDVGADAVLLTLASDSDDPVHAAAEMSRHRGRLVLVGVTGLALKRDDFYKKELSFQVSASYGPGRYDSDYESGRDYPIGLVRWTARRNFEAVLWQLSQRALDVAPLISHRFPLENAAAAYDVVGGTEASLGILLEYAAASEAPSISQIPAARATAPAAGAPVAPAKRGVLAVSAIGAGEFGVRVILPALKDAGADLRVIASRGGVSAARALKRFGFQRASSSYTDVLADPDTNAVVILTRHDSHARLTAEALRAGMHVFVEKPLALTLGELADVANAATASGRVLAVGFNRRWAPLARSVSDGMRGRSGPASIIITVNAGALPADHWTRDPAAGGGRITGEACHFIDLARFLAGSPIRAVSVTAARRGAVIDDVATITLEFADGSFAHVHYLANGSRRFPKERVECFWDGHIACIDNWTAAQGYGWRGPRSRPFAAQDKGHSAQIEAFARAVREGTSAPVPLEEVLEVSRCSIVAGELARRGGGRLEIGNWKLENGDWIGGKEIGDR